MSNLIEQPWRARNVFIRFSYNVSAYRGGLYASDRLTNAELAKMIRVAFHAEGGYTIRFEQTGLELPDNQERVQHGVYVLKPMRFGVTIRPNGELLLDRKVDSRSGNQDFIDYVQHRDFAYCAILGFLKPDKSGEWPTTKMTYIFPSGQGEVFDLLPFPVPPEGVHCAQNVISLEENLHRAWEARQIAVDPDNSYGVISLHPHTSHCQGRSLHSVCRDPEDPYRVSDDLLRWHYRQTVIHNLLGDGRNHLRYPSSSPVPELYTTLVPYGGDPGYQYREVSYRYDELNSRPLDWINRDWRADFQPGQSMHMYRPLTREREERSNQRRPAAHQEEAMDNPRELN